MRLADFIAANIEPILVEWVAFAKSRDPSGAMDSEALRDHARDMLTVIVADLRAPQSERARSAKSKGHAPENAGTDTAAEVHGAGRAKSGFSVGDMVSEYRALRASVIRLWTRTCGALAGEALDDLVRFDEAIDQALAESLTRYTEDIEQSRELFLAILGHDLRTPLGAVITSGQFMLDAQELEDQSRTLTAGIVRSARRMNAMVDDLLDFTRIRLGSGVPLVRVDTDMAAVARDAVDEAAAAHPGRVIEFAPSGDLTGCWDAARVDQVLSNLLGNAVQHGDPAAPIRVTVGGEGKNVVLKVHNRGATIPAGDLAGLFNPLKRLQSGAAGAGAANLGLGLYIVEQIVSAHGGTIEVASGPDAGTSFTVCLPR